MQVQQIQDSPSFGMATFIKQAKIKKCLGNKIAGNIESVRPEIERMAHDVDIIIKPSRFDLSKKEFVRITVREKDLSLLEMIRSIIGLRTPYEQHEYIHGSNASPEWIVERCAKTKRALLDYTG